MIAGSYARRSAVNGRPLRMLFAFVGGAGHLLPLVPVAMAARAAGHAVAFTGDSTTLTLVLAAGFEAFPTTAGRPPGPPERRPLAPLDPAREERDLRELFARDGARRRAAGMVERIEAWHPDIVICDEVDFGTVIAAERLGLPYVTVVVLAAGGLIRPDVVGAALDEVRLEHGLAPDPTLAALGRYLVLAPAPPSLRDPRFPLPATAFGIRNDAPDASLAAAPPPWRVTRPDGPALYVTLGTIFNIESGDLLERILTALEDHPGDVIATVGAEIDPSELGPRPDHIHIERFIAQSAVLPHVQAVISHAGSGSVLGALAHGRPMVLLPMGADQPLNAARCVATGAAVALDPVAATPATIRDAVLSITDDRAFAHAAGRLQAEMAALPAPEDAVDRIVALVRGWPT